MGWKEEGNLCDQEITPAKAKKVVAQWFKDNGLPPHKLTGKTVGFMDLARENCVFVKVHGWQASPSWDGLRKTAMRNGFRVEAAGFPD
jgi:hypothetical protein